jgi:His-Xaa-Ser system protein HxsD
MAGVVVEFTAESQSIAALREAAYRLIGQATCQIETQDGVHHCSLEAAPKSRIGEADLRARFLDLVTDENLREQIAAATEPTRNLILALAFGALAKAEDAAG